MNENPSMMHPHASPRGRPLAPVLLPQARTRRKSLECSFPITQMMIIATIAAPNAVRLLTLNVIPNAQRGNCFLFIVFEVERRLT
jgi:hypothetical protein